MNALSLAPQLPELSEFSEEEEHTGIHVLPTLSMPPVPADDTATTAISNTIAALLAESEAEEKLEDVSESLEEEDTQAVMVVVTTAGWPLGAAARRFSTSAVPISALALASVV